MQEKLNKTLCGDIRKPEINNKELEEELKHIIKSLKENGYDEVSQFTGFLVSGDPGYITAKNKARSIAGRLERWEVIKLIVSKYIETIETE